MRIALALTFMILSYSIAVQAQHTGMRMEEYASTPAHPNNLPLLNLLSSSYRKQIGKRVEYDLYVKDTMVNFTGKHKHAIAINGQIPAPTVVFTEGDTAIIRVHNLMKMETSIHWHGILLPNIEDGVPYLTTAPIKPGMTHTFTFPLIQSGTYWYHSHTMLQEQSGMYGAIVIHPADKEYDLNEYVVVLSDWTDENPHQVLRYLKRAGEWYAIKKGAVQSYGEAIAAGALKEKLKQEWGRMPAMDVTDVYYNKFLMNGNEKAYFQDVTPGEIVRLRIINGSASSYFTLQYAGGIMQVISADGINIESFPTNKLEIATAETYDLLITIPENGAYELRATVSDVSGYTSGFFGSGMNMTAPDIPKLDYFQMMREMNEMDMSDMSHGSNDMDMGASTKDNPLLPDTVPLKEDQPMNMQNMDHMNMAGMGSDMKDMGEMQMGMAGDFSYNQLRALNPTTLDPDQPWREIKLTLTGNMLRYIWSFDHKTLSRADKIPIRRGENVRVILENSTMMRHPLHLHGHFFRLVNDQDEYSPLKHSFDIRPMETVTIEFDANEEQDWFFHCHILYHMMAGMARIVSYEGSEQNEFALTGYKHLKKEDNLLYPWFDLSVHSQGAWLDVNVSNNLNALEFDGRINWKGDYETESHLLRYLDKRQFLSAFIGFDFRGIGKLPLNEMPDEKVIRKEFEAGFYYMLPMFIRSEWRIGHTGKLRLQLERRDMALNNNFFFDWLINTDKEYAVSFRYMVSKYFSVSTNYDSDYGWGAGLTLTY